LVKRDVNGNNEDELYTWLKVWMLNCCRLIPFLCHCDKWHSDLKMLHEITFSFLWNYM
jgi:hypothetical protein